MSFQTKSRVTRDSADTDWYVITDEYKAYRKTNFEDTNKLEGIARTDVSDTVREVVVTWKDEASAQEWYVDSTCAAFREARNTYESNNGIVRINPGNGLMEISGGTFVPD